VRLVWLGFCLLGGCAQLSGLDGLGVCGDSTCKDSGVDASVDAPIDAPADDGPLDAAVGDAFVEGGPALDAHFGAPCDVPGDCFGSNLDQPYPPDSGAVCCETATLIGTYPQCKIQSTTVACAKPADCLSKLPNSCATEQGRRCAYDSECIEANFDKCCSLPIEDGGIIHVCASTIIAGYLGGSCP
jgi:hypothetical protein